MQWSTAAMLVCAVLLYLLHFLHLRADFPNHSPWMDWSKYTDEGWYGDAAIRHYLRGRWLLPGDFNPAVALPVWPLLEAVVFRFAGVGIVGARALAVLVFGGVTACGYALLREQNGTPGGVTQRMCSVAALLMLAANSFIYAFTRVAIVEPLLILITSCALLLACRMRYVASVFRRTACACLLGVLVALMVATKTTAVFLLPSVLWMLGSSSRWEFRRVLRDAGLAGLVAGVLWGAYITVLSYAGLLGDFRYLFSANQYTGVSRETLFAVLGETFHDGMWMGSLLYPVGLVGLLGVALWPRMRRDHISVALAFWVVGYAMFMAYHANFQPRYYLVIAVPLTLLIARAAMHLVSWSRLCAYALIPLLGIVVAQELYHTLFYIRHPEYSFQTAARELERVVESEPAHSHTVLSISGSTLSLMTGLPSICDDFGTMDIEDRIATYKPGWFVTWNYVEDDKMEALTKFYRLTRVAAFPAMDDPNRNLMIVYRLDLREGVQPKRRRYGLHKPQVDAG